MLDIEGQWTGEDFFKKRNQILDFLFADKFPGISIFLFSEYFSRKLIICIVGSGTLLLAIGKDKKNIMMQEYKSSQEPSYNIIFVL